MAKMTATVLKNYNNSKMDVLLTWENAPERTITSYDWIGAFDEKLMTEFHAPIKFRYVFPHGARRPLQRHGSMNFTIWNHRNRYVFIYISGNIQYPSIVAQSDIISFDVRRQPMQPHIALSPNDSTKMLIMWTQMDPANPAIKWGHSPDKLENVVSASRDTYTRSDFCDSGTSAAGRQGWFEPGYFMKAEMPIEPGATYYYTCGDADDGWHHTLNFTAPPAAKDEQATRLILLADMGNTPYDKSLHHSWDFNNHGELPSRNTSRLVGHLLDKENAHAVVHFGDIAYAVGYLSEWDEFMQQISPVASRIPWMTSIGNHEVGWSGSDSVFNGTLNTAMDSGGECGVAFMKRFPFSMQPLPANTHLSNASPWYSFNVGHTHFTMLSSEHDFTIGSPQWQWMVSDLAKVDRSSTPWLVVTSHRGMYLASDFDGDTNVAKLLQEHVEPQLLKYGVDIFLAGHHHSYQRFCKLNKGKCVDGQSGEHGIYHFIVGMAGYDHSEIVPNYANAQKLDNTTWGATYWEFNRTTATMKFLDGATDEVVDKATFHKSSVTADWPVVV